MNKAELLLTITKQVRAKHPWYISQERFLAFFGELPKEFLNERLAYDNLLVKAKDFKLCQLILSETKIEIKLTLDQCIEWELARWDDAKAHHITVNDIKKLLKEREQ
jgi:hypothetical protein